MYFWGLQVGDAYQVWIISQSRTSPVPAPKRTPPPLPPQKNRTVYRMNVYLPCEKDFFIAAKRWCLWGAPEVASRSLTGFQDLTKHNTSTHTSRHEQILHIQIRVYIHRPSPNWISLPPSVALGPTAASAEAFLGFHPSTLRAQPDAGSRAMDRSWPR